MPKAPMLVKAIPPQAVNEGGAYGPFDLKEYIQSPDAESGSIRFMAELADGRALPKGLICTSSGLLSGIPANGTKGDYEFTIIAENDVGIPFTTQLQFKINPRITVESDQFYTKLKAQIWEAVGNNLPIPQIDELFSREISPIEIYYLLERFAYLAIWDVYNLDFPSEKVLLNIEGMNEHYNAYDRGSCLIVAPKDLFSHERTSADMLDAARVLAREAYNRGWTIEFAGFEKMIRAAWVELRLIGDKTGKYLEVLHFTPTNEDVKIYIEQARVQAMSTDLNM